jgi:hypothetical protein
MSCPTPHKLRFATVEAATRFAARRELGVGKLLRPYACDGDGTPAGCTWIHLTSDQPVAPASTADPALVNELRHATPDQFRDFVETEAAGHLDMPRRIALRHPRLYGRWVRALNELAAALDARIGNAPAGSDWAQRAAVYRHHLDERLAEAQTLNDARKAA